jgi:hypothetical protein
LTVACNINHIFNIHRETISRKLKALDLIVISDIMNFNSHPLIGFSNVF